ncbi:MAG: sensor histidine kinase [Cyanobacteria bacterium J055]|nr:MAG: sensor histidine kinase [Cyanobacteria bacterium J055]
MLAPASSEFVALCREQTALLTRGLGASIGIVYLTEKLLGGEGNKPIAIVVEPETAAVWTEGQGYSGLPDDIDAPITGLPLLPGKSNGDRDDADPVTGSASSHENSDWWQKHQTIVPLVHEGAFMGFLVARRLDRPWCVSEQAQIERIARTIAIACFLDRRARWWERNYQQQQQLQTGQRDILHSLLHQFRNPLSALKIFGKLLLKRVQPGDPSRDFAASIVTESDRLQDLAQQFKQTLDAESGNLALPRAILPKGVAGAIELESEKEPEHLKLLPASEDEVSTLSVAEILEPLVRSAKAIAADGDLALTYHLLGDVPPVRANPQALREVLSNLIDNALKYTPAGGRVDIQAGVATRQQERELAIAISDTGYGIPPQDLERLFERGYRGEKANGEIPGTGLGLAIARELIERMGGEIQAFSPAQPPWDIPNFPTGEGTTFVLWLPIREDR